MTRVFLLDDHEVVRRGVRELLEAEGDLEVVGEASNAAEAMTRIPVTHPDVAILDVRLPDGDGIEVCREIRSRHPEVACLMLTSYADDEAYLGAVMAGAAGYVLKQIRGGELVEGIRTVATGASLFDPATTDLTLRERQVLRLITDGLTNRQIGERLGLAEKTVKNYASGLFAKLGMERRTQAAVFGASVGDGLRRPIGRP